MALYKGNTKVAPVVVYIPIDSALSATSEKAVQNKVVTQALNEKQDTSNLVTSISSASTDTQYPSAKCVYDLLGNSEDLSEALKGITAGETWVSFNTFTIYSDGLGLTGEFDEVKASVCGEQPMAFLLNDGEVVTSVSGNTFYFDWTSSSYNTSAYTFFLNFTDKTNSTLISVEA